jgi:hypothetical protein
MPAVGPRANESAANLILASFESFYGARECQRKSRFGEHWCHLAFTGRYFGFSPTAPVPAGKLSRKKSLARKYKKRGSTFAARETRHEKLRQLLWRDFV